MFRAPVPAGVAAGGGAVSWLPPAPDRVVHRPDGTVAYETVDPTSGAPVLVHTLDDAGTRAGVRAVVQHAALLGRLAGHPALQQLVERTSWNGHPAVVLSWHPESVADALAIGPIEPLRAVRIAAHAAAALETVHRAGIVHGCVSSMYLFVRLISCHTAESAMENSIFSIASSYFATVV